MTSYKDVLDFINSYKKHPLKTIIVAVLLLFFLCLIAFCTGFFNKKGEQVAQPTIEKPIAVIPPTSSPQEKQEAESPKVQQHTEGDNSPAVNAGGDVNIDIGGNKK